MRKRCGSVMPMRRPTDGSLIPPSPALPAVSTLMLVSTFATQQSQTAYAAGSVIMMSCTLLIGMVLRISAMSQQLQRISPLRLRLTM